MTEAAIRFIFRENLKKILSSWGSKKHFAEKVGVDRRMVYRWIEGYIPTPAHLAKISEVLNIDVFELFLPLEKG